MTQPPLTPAEDENALGLYGHGHVALEAFVVGTPSSTTTRPRC